MKGIAHFAVGLTAAGLFPEAVREAAGGNPLYMLLGGIFGLLPDTLDFKLNRFLSRHDIEVTPDPDRPDAGMIANAVATAVHLAWCEGKPVKIKLNTIRLGADAWHRYFVRFDVPARRVEAVYGREVGTSGDPVLAAGREDTAKSGARAASVQLACNLALEYEAETAIDIFDGPVFCFTPTGDGTVRVGFIPWHRQWSHSLPVGLVFGLAGAVAWDALAGTVIFLAHALHALADRMGFMGVNLFYPFQKDRKQGLGWMKSTEALPNFAVVWCCCVALFWSLAAHTPGGRHEPGLAQLLVGAGAAPVAVFAALDRWLMKGVKGGISVKGKKGGKGVKGGKGEKSVKGGKSGDS